jgi:hypothetical protein
MLLLALLAAPPGPVPSVPHQRPVHWAIALGMRAEQVNRAFPTVDQVVLVPDEATYIDELARWSPQGRWPVLFEDGHLAPMFIRHFGPGRVIRREPADNEQAAAPVTKRRIEATVIRVWGGNPQQDTIRGVCDRHGYVPPGVVIASTNDPAWAAAVALAAGRGQPIGWLDESSANPNRMLDAEAARRLSKAVDDLVTATGYPHDRLGDAIETITVCRAVAGRAEIPFPGGAPTIVAVTDLLGRRDNGERYAFAGWIFGDHARSAYTAMCSLFLTRHRFLLVNTYPAGDPWGAYDTKVAAMALADRGFTTLSRRGRDAGLRAWLAALPGGVSGDVLAMNSKGNAGFFDLTDGRAYPGDVPMLNEPLAVHFTHSFSMRSPGNASTVAGRWLQRGAYAYVGAVDEPGLAAFLTPTDLAERWTAGVPFLVGARRWRDSGPWKVSVYGDPLMGCLPPGSPARLSPPDDDRGLDLKMHAARVMRRIASDKTGTEIPEAIRTLALLGQDEIAVQMWRYAAESERPAAAAPALGSLFRAGRHDDFVAAWRLVDDHDDRAVDMLWHLLTPRLGGADAATLRLLVSKIRPGQAEADLERLLAPLTAAFGAAFARQTIQREINRTTNPRARRRLEKLLKSVP